MYKITCIETSKTNVVHYNTRNLCCYEKNRACNVIWDMLQQEHRIPTNVLLY